MPDAHKVFAEILEAPPLTPEERMDAFSDMALEFVRQDRIEIAKLFFAFAGMVRIEYVGKALPYLPQAETQYQDQALHVLPVQMT